MSAARRPSRGKARTRPVDPARRVAYDALRAVTAAGAYANLVLPELLAERRLDTRDAAFATELVNGTCRLQGTYDAVIQRASGRPLSSLQPAVVDVLRLGAHQVLSMRVPAHAAVAASVDLVANAVGERATGVVNAVLRRVSERDLDAWMDLLAAGLTGVEEAAVRQHHPRWVAQAFSDVLGPVGAERVMEADNRPPVTALAVRPGLASVAELVAEGARPGSWSPYAALVSGSPSGLAAVREGRAGVQDEGSQLVALALSRVDAPTGPWLDLCAGPGGKAGLLAGLALQQGADLVANEITPHRAELVTKTLAAARDQAIATGLTLEVRTGDGREIGQAEPAAYDRVLVDAPCTGLGALRRRPEARWRRTPGDVAALAPLQRELLASALDAVAPGGVVAYATCSPHLAETRFVVDDLLKAHPDMEQLDAREVVAAVSTGWADLLGPGPAVQLWTHLHGTDAMYLALLRKRAVVAG